MRKRYFGWITALLLLALSLSGCTGMMMEAVEASAEKTGLVEPANQMLTGLLEGDIDACMSLLSPQITKSDFQQAYGQFREVLKEVDTYTLTPTYVNVHTADGVTTNQVRFKMESGDLMFLVDAVSVSNQEGIAGFHITPYIPVTTTGTITTLRGADALQWIFLVVAALETAFVVWMVVDCVRRKMQYKPLWLLLILLGNLIFSLTRNEGNMSVNFNFGLALSYTALLRYSTGGFVARLLLPIGAVVYFAVRKSMKPKTIPVNRNIPSPYYPQNPPQPYYPQNPSGQASAESTSENAQAADNSDME